MPYYRVYVLDAQSRISGGHDLECDNDQSACREAARLYPDQAWELWRGDQRIVCGGPEPNA